MDISLHSNKKHLAISYYLSSVIRDLIKSPRMPFHILYYVDLYCGDGTCIIKTNEEKYDPPLIESILKPAKNGELNVICFLNDKSSINIKKMKDNTKDYEQFIEEYKNGDANIVYKEFLEKIPADQFSIFILDPFRHSELKWDTIKGIAEHSAKYRGNKIRRPELVITFMTYSLCRAVNNKSSHKGITEALGTDKWMSTIREFQNRRIQAPIENAFLSVFIEQLKSIGYMVPTPIKILNTNAPNTIYYLIWTTSNEKGYEIIENKLMRYIRRVLLRTHEKNINIFKTEKVKAEIEKAKAENRNLNEF